MSADSLRLSRFLPHHSETVAAWVVDDLELFWLAPSTRAPLTPEKVLAWAPHSGNPYVLCHEEDQAPIGYAELNPLREAQNRLWIGHLIVAPAWRGQGIGRNGKRARKPVAGCFGQAA